jgi:hypothetical protein
MSILLWLGSRTAEFWPSAEVPSKHDQIVDFVRGWVPTVEGIWPYRIPPQPYSWNPYSPQPVPSLPTAEDLAHQLLHNTEFRSLQLGSWLGTTDGQVISRAVAVGLASPYRQEFQLVVDALVLAANLQQQHGQKVAGGWAAGVASTVLLRLLLSGRSS